MTIRHNSQFLVAIGGNLQFTSVSSAETILLAAERMREGGQRGVRLSRLYATPSFPPGSGADYVNAAAVVDAGRFGPAEALNWLHGIEAEFGRERRERWGGRVLDLDLVAMGDEVLPDAATQDHWRALPLTDQRRITPGQLILPHPRVQDRAFVLVPLADVAPDWRHPRLNMTVTEMLARLPTADLAGIRPIG